MTRQQKKAAIRRKRRKLFFIGGEFIGVLFLLVCLYRISTVRGGTGQISPQSLAENYRTEAVVLPGTEGLPVAAKDNVQAEKKELQEKESEILLVNKTHKLPDDYQVPLVLLPDGFHYAAEEAYEPLMDMLEAGASNGLHFVVCSAYRNVKRQEELFQEDVDALMRSGYSYQEAYDEVARSTMPPGYSEHSTGLAFDIVALDYQMLDKGQEKTGENKWLRKHCAEYGFILRYPDGKEDVTGISYESWHFRYVGKEAAQEIMQNNFTLEEYLAAE